MCLVRQEKSGQFIPFLRNIMVPLMFDKTPRFRLPRKLLHYFHLSCSISVWNLHDSGVREAIRGRWLCRRLLPSPQRDRQEWFPVLLLLLLLTEKIKLRILLEERRPLGISLSFAHVSVSASSFTLLSHSLRLNLSRVLYSLLSFSPPLPFPSFVLFSHSLCLYSTRVSLPFHLLPKFLSLLPCLVPLPHSLHSKCPGQPMLQHS